MSKFFVESFVLRPNIKVLKFGTKGMVFIGGECTFFVSQSEITDAVFSITNSLRCGKNIVRSDVGGKELGVASKFLKSLLSKKIIMPASLDPPPGISNHWLVYWLGKPEESFGSNGVKAIFAEPKVIYVDDVGREILNSQFPFERYCVTRRSRNQSYLYEIELSCFQLVIENKNYVVKLIRCAGGAIEVNARESEDCSSFHYPEIENGLMRNIVMHSIDLAFIGIGVSGCITENYVNALHRDVRTNTYSGLTPLLEDSRLKTSPIEDIQLICQYAAGTISEDGNLRRIAPSAGNLCSTHILYFCFEDNRRILTFYYVSPGSEKIEKIYSAVVKKESDVPVGLEKGLIVVSTSGRLRIRYGDFSNNLLFYDAGITIGYARKLALEFGYSVSGVKDEVLAFLKYASRNILLGVDSSLVYAMKIQKSGDDYLRNESRQRTMLAMLSRRSFRGFDGTCISSKLANQVERRFFDSFSREHNDSLKSFSLIRIQKSSEERYITTQIIFDNNALEVSAREGISPLAQCVVRQSDLQGASLVYLVGYPGLNENVERKLVESYLFTGSVLSAIWLEATQNDIKGTICGLLDLDSLKLQYPLLTLSDIALCLGVG